MEHSVQLGTQHYHASLSQCLQELQKQEALPLHINETLQGKRWLIECQFSLPTDEMPARQEPTVKKIFQYYLADAVAETILSSWEQEHIKRRLAQKYKLKKEEREVVLAKVLARLDEREDNGGKTSRKKGLMSQILICLESSAVFDIEGFLHFRGREYKGALNKTIDYIVDEYMLEQEYVEFIELLKSFVDMQKPRLETLHVVISARGRFNLYDDKGNYVTDEYLTDYHPNNTIQDISYDDLLISALIAVSPRQVVMHVKSAGAEDTLHSIRQVFGDRVSFCTGCSLCDKN